MDQSWDDRIALFWASANDANPGLLLTAMERLVSERPEGDAEAVFELASVHDFLGHEAVAIPLYRLALETGLSGDREPRAVIQLASSLRNVGETAAAIELLEESPEDTITGSAAQAFLALALYDSGRSREALRVALKALAVTVPLYGRAVSSYADELAAEKSAS